MKVTAGGFTRLTNTQYGHSKFWAVRVDGRTAEVAWGRIGTAGQTQTKTFASEEDAAQFGEDKINEKLRGGYV